ncbi:MAG: MotA/TolQ/ExbB proton channel family protein [Firmicutes bacterium]|nr:MotA/TolQ/ExbB proton channel family protein [Bacillota bacterium]
MVEIILRGGPLMIPLLLCSVFAVAISLERLWYLWRSRIDTEDLMDDVKLALQSGKVLEAMQIAKKSRGPVAAVIAAGIAYYDRPVPEIRQHMEEVGNLEVYKLERRLPILEVLVGVAPLLGLLGTVTGIIRIFNVMAGLRGLGDPAAMSGGIAEALITTAAGLAIAIPTMLIYSYFSGLIDKFVTDMNKRISELLNVLESRGEY